MGPTTNNLKLVFGGGAFMRPDKWTEDIMAELLDYLEKEGINIIDTAEGYGASEAIIGKSGAASRGFEIDTKVTGGLSSDVRATKENVIKAGEQSLEKLAVDQVRIVCLECCAFFLAS
jgi:aflatoxin B1 aldehyde reductase